MGPVLTVPPAVMGRRCGSRLAGFAGAEVMPCEAPCEPHCDPLCIVAAGFCAYKETGTSAAKTKARSKDDVMNPSGSRGEASGLGRAIRVLESYLRIYREQGTLRIIEAEGA